MTAEPLFRALRPLTILAAVCLATWAVSYLLHFPSTGIDDADIFLVYARNISAGAGFVFNAGGERVEGFTSLLWVLVCSGTLMLTGNPERLLLGLNVGLVLLTIDCCLRSCVFHRSSRDGAISLPWAATFLILLLADYRYVAWNTVALMETALWSCLLTVSTLLVVRDRVDRKQGAALAMVIGLMILTRPEALIWGAAMLLLFFVKGVSIEGYAASVRFTAPGVLSYALTAGLLTLFRLWYFGFPLPNTYYAKVSPVLAFTLGEGGNYLWSYISSGPVPFAAAVAVVVSILHVVKGKLRDTRMAAFCVLACLGLLIPVLTGGDHFGGFRFYQSAYPILLLALFNCVRFVIPQYVASTNLERLPRVSVLVGGAVLSAFFLASEIVDWMSFAQRLPIRLEFDIARAGRERGSQANRLFAEFSPRPTIGTITVGGFQYAYSGGHVIDLMGLNNTRMAHNGGSRIGLRSHAAFEKQVFYEQRPTAVVPLVQYGHSLPCLQAKSQFADQVLKGLLDDVAFQAAYRLAEIRKSTPEGFVAVAAWYDREFLAGLADRKDVTVSQGVSTSGCTS